MKINTPPLANKIIIIFFALHCLIYTISIKAQDLLSPVIIQQNNISSIEGYIFKNENSLDSFLITKEYFNTKGYQTKIVIYDSSGIKGTYVYNYKDDTLRTERITIFHDSIHSITRLYYDHKYREVAAIDFDKDGKKKGTFYKIDYNERRKTKQIRFYLSDKLIHHTKTKYNDTGTVIEFAKKINGKWIYKKPPFVELETFVVDGLKAERRTSVIISNETILGLSGKLKLTVGDTLINEKFINSKNLILYEKQFLNNNLICIKKYIYLYYLKNTSLIFPDRI